MMEDFNWSAMWQDLRTVVSRLAVIGQCGVAVKLALKPGNECVMKNKSDSMFRNNDIA